MKHEASGGAIGSTVRDPLADSLKATLRASLKSDLPHSPVALKRAIGNLAVNALYYGKRAEITTRAEIGSVSIAVRDLGPGVPEDALASLFDPYMRLEHGREQSDNGMGLGLGIARGVIEAHGDQLILENHPEGGLHATIRLSA